LKFLYTCVLQRSMSSFTCVADIVPENHRFGSKNLLGCWVIGSDLNQRMWCFHWGVLEIIKDILLEQVGPVSCRLLLQQMIKRGGVHLKNIPKDNQSLSFIIQCTLPPVPSKLISFCFLLQRIWLLQITNI